MNEWTFTSQTRELKPLPTIRPHASAVAAQSKEEFANNWSLQPCKRFSILLLRSTEFPWKLMSVVAQAQWACCCSMDIFAFYKSSSSSSSSSTDWIARLGLIVNRSLKSVCSYSNCMSCPTTVHSSCMAFSVHQANASVKWVDWAYVYQTKL